MTAHLLDRLIAQPGARLACIAGGESLTYAELRARIDAHAAALRARGIGANGIVAFDAARGPETIALMLATLHVGAAYLPLDPALPDERRRQILEDAKPDLIVELDRFASSASTNRHSTAIWPTCFSRPARPAARKAWRCAPPPSPRSSTGTWRIRVSANPRARCSSRR